MRLSAIDVVTCKTPASSLPMRLRHKARTTQTVVLSLLATPVIVACVVPFVIAAAAATGQEAGAIGAIVEQPLASLKLVGGMALALGLVSYPLHVIAGRIGGGQMVRITAKRVSVAERTLRGLVRWHEPIANYRGLAHHIRASLSNARHEIVLVHSDPRRNILLQAGDRVVQGDLDRLAEMLRLPVVPAAEIYRRLDAQVAVGRKQAEHGATLAAT